MNLEPFRGIYQKGAHGLVRRRAGKGRISFGFQIPSEPVDGVGGLKQGPPPPHPGFLICHRKWLGHPEPAQGPCTHIPNQSQLPAAAVARTAQQSRPAW